VVQVMDGEQAAQVGGWRVGRTGGPLVGRWPAPSGPARAACERKEEEGEGRKGKEEKKKREKGKREKKEKKRERGKERAAGAIRGGGRPRARCDAQPVDDVHAEREKERRDRDWYWCRDSGLSGHDFGRLGVRAEKDFGVI